MAHYLCPSYKQAQENTYTSKHFYIYASLKSVSKISETSGIMPY